MIVLPLNQKTKLACNCEPGKPNCPYCEGAKGALPNLNRDALEAALEILAKIGMKPMERVVFAYLPDPAMPQGFRVCTAPIAAEGGAYLAEGADGAALLLLMEEDGAKRAGLIPNRVEPGDALEGIADAYAAMDLPPIALER